MSTQKEHKIIHKILHGKFHKHSELNSVPGQDVLADGLCHQGTKVLLAGRGKNMLVQVNGFGRCHRSIE